MRNIKLKIFTVVGLILLQAQVFAQDAVVQAIRDLRDKTLNALQGSAANSIVNTLNTILVADPSGKIGIGKLPQAIIDAKIDLYIKNFYSYYATDEDFINTKLVKINGAIKGSGSVIDLLRIKEKSDQGIKDLLNQEIYYATQKSMEDKIKDSDALILLPAENEANNIKRNTKVDSSTTLEQRAKGGSPYGSLDSKNKQTDKNTKNILSINALIGPDGYKDQEAEDAKLFINQLAQVSPPPKNFYIPQAKSGRVTVYLPYADKVNNTPYTKVSVNAECPITGCKNGQSEYLNMIDTLNKNSLYREYKMKVRSKLALRTLVFDNIFRVFQERYKASAEEKSLVEKEKEMALVGLTQDYYNNLKKKSVADVNLEMLYTLNKVVYFLHKLHRDNERTQLLMSVYGMQALPADAQDETQYLKPIGALIENKCWDLGLSEVPSGKTQEERREICPKT